MVDGMMMIGLQAVPRYDWLNHLLTGQRCLAKHKQMQRYKPFLRADLPMLDRWLSPNKH